MFGWCERCQTVAIEGICSKHGRTMPLSYISAVDPRPLTAFEKQFYNERMDNLTLKDGIFLVFSDRMFRRKVIFLDVPLIEVRFHRGDIRVVPLCEGQIHGMNVDAFVATNRDRLNRMLKVSESFAEHEIRHSENAIVSHSGGKDSTVLADMLSRFELPEVFIDTKLEFHETYDFINNSKVNGHEIDITRATTSFFSLVGSYGYPTHGKRWCCKTQKFEPFSRYVGERYGNREVLVFSGERRWEGVYRLNEPLTRRHRYIENQLTVQPLLDWLALDIWNYIWSKQLPINPIYEYFDRAGCWLCPFGLEYRIFLLQFSHPKLYKILEKIRGMKTLEAMRMTNYEPCVAIAKRHKLIQGKARTADGIGEVTASCGDSMQLHIKARDDRIVLAEFTSKGCAASVACGYVATMLAKGKNLTDAQRITSRDILHKLGRLPDSETHCAILATEALNQAIRNCLPASRAQH